MPVPPGPGRLVPLFNTVACIVHKQQINETLAGVLPKVGIERHITTHSARKTFAITMCADRGISCEVAAELMGNTVAVMHHYSVTNYKIEREVKKAWTSYKA